MTSVATLSSSGEFTAFSFGGHVIRFRTSPHLERYTSVKEWDAGYIVCSAKYDNAQAEEEESWIVKLSATQGQKRPQRETSNSGICVGED